MKILVSSLLKESVISRRGEDGPLYVERVKFVGHLLFNVSR